jgi:hypothetical protein
MNLEIFGIYTKAHYFSLFISPLYNGNIVQFLYACNLIFRPQYRFHIMYSIEIQIMNTNTNAHF